MTVSWEWQGLRAIWALPESRWWIRLLRGAFHIPYIHGILYNWSQWDFCQATKSSAGLETSSDREPLSELSCKKILKDLFSSRIRYLLGRMVFRSQLWNTSIPLKSSYRSLNAFFAHSFHWHHQKRDFFLHAGAKAETNILGVFRFISGYKYPEIALLRHLLWPVPPRERERGAGPGAAGPCLQCHGNSAAGTGTGTGPGRARRPRRWSRCSPRSPRCRRGRSCAAPGARMRSKRLTTGTCRSPAGLGCSGTHGARAPRWRPQVQGRWHKKGAFGTDGCKLARQNSSLRRENFTAFKWHH